MIQREFSHADRRLRAAAEELADRHPAFRVSGVRGRVHGVRGGHAADRVPRLLLHPHLRGVLVRIVNRGATPTRPAPSRGRGRRAHYGLEGDTPALAGRLDPAVLQELTDSAIGSSASLPCSAAGFRTRRDAGETHGRPAVSRPPSSLLAGRGEGAPASGGTPPARFPGPGTGAPRARIPSVVNPAAT